MAGVGNTENFFIEIAYTKNKVPHNYTSAVGFSAINTNICWVRTAYLENVDITTFGTHKQCPINLAFLVQKPCDYIKQTSDNYADRVHVKYNGTDDDKSLADITLKGVYAGKYIILSLLNEAVSPLIKGFKDKKGMPRFENKYKLEDKLSTIEASNFIRALLVAGIAEYEVLRTRKAKKKGSHGKAGLKRAGALRTALENCKTTPQMSQVVYDCFKNNKVGSFKGGFLNKIRTNPSSLFTCVCRVLLPTFIGNVDSVKNWHKRGRQLKGKGNTIQCLAHKATHSGFDRSEDTVVEFITTLSPELLKAIKRL